MATYRAQTSNAGLARTLTPEVGDLFVMLVVASGNANDAPTCTDDNPAGDGTYTLIGVLPWNASGSRASIFVRNALLANTTPTLVTVNVGTATTTFTALVAIGGMTLTGAAAIRQYGEQENQAAGIPQATVAGACLTDNLTMTAVFSNDFSQTPPTGWTERVENGVPPCINVCTRDNGYTGTGEPYNAASSSVFAAAFVEFEAGAGGGGGAAVYRRVIGSRVVGSPIIRRMRR